MVTQVHVYLDDNLCVMSPLLIKPEHSRRTGLPGTDDCELDPVSNWLVLRLAHTENIVCFYRLFQPDLTAVSDQTYHTSTRCHKRLVMRTIFFSLPRHQPNV